MAKRKHYRKRHLTRAQKKRKTQRNILLGLIFLAVIMLILIVAGMVRIVKKWNSGDEMWNQQAYSEVDNANIDASRPNIDVQLLTINPYSRCAEKADKITGIVIHYTANPGTTAQSNHDYFESLKDEQTTKASSNFVVGLDGEIIQCIPTWEIAYASNERNHDTVSIECCHPDETGAFNSATYQSVVQLTAWLCMKFELTEEDVIRHYDVTGKICPKYYVENEDAWKQFKEDVRTAIAAGGQ